MKDGKYVALSLTAEAVAEDCMPRGDRRHTAALPSECGAPAIDRERLRRQGAMSLSGTAGRSMCKV